MAPPLRTAGPAGFTSGDEHTVCQVGVFLAYASRFGQALIDRRLYLPEAWATDAARRAKTQVPSELAFATKPEIARDLSARLAGLFLRGPDGRRPVLGDNPLLQDDPHFRDLIPFHEYFHGDSGKGLGAAHQTGWTGLVALLLQPRVSRMGSLMAVAQTPESPVPDAAPPREAARP